MKTNLFSQQGPMASIFFFGAMFFSALFCDSAIAADKNKGKSGGKMERGVQCCQANPECAGRAVATCCGVSGIPGCCCGGASEESVSKKVKKVSKTAKTHTAKKDVASGR